jgi:hypothetical protein
LFGRLPLAFEANQGQADPRVRFLARGTDHVLFLTRDESVLVLRAAGAAGGDNTKRGPRLQAKDGGRNRVVRMRFLGGGGAPRLVGLDGLPGRSNHLIGSDPRRWRRGVPLFARVKYESLYPGVDLIFHGSEGPLEYDLVVAPGASPDVIRIGFQGTGRLRLDESGDLILPVGDGEVVQHAPRIYQEVDGARRMIGGTFVLRGRREVGFAITGTHDPGRALVIDPVLSYSTYLGGASDDTAQAIAVDNSGSAYLAGSTFSSDFPLANAFQSTRRGYGDVFVTKIDPNGGALVYSTYLGGNEYDAAHGIAIDNSGSAYVTGTTSSTDFPVTDAFQPAFRGGTSYYYPTDAFVAKLTPDGSALVYSTYLGGGGDDAGAGIAVDGSGSASVAGRTNSIDFPLARPLQPGRAGLNFYITDAFVTRLTPSGSALVFSTYLGGRNWELPAGVAVDPAGNTYVTGHTDSPDFPTFGALRAAPDQVRGEAFVTKFNPSGTGFVYSLLLGGSNQDQGTAIAADASGNAYVAGSTYSSDFPIRNPVQASRGGSSGWDVDAFAAKIDPGGSALVYSTFLGGSRPEAAGGIAVDARGQAHLVGSTSSRDFPQERPLEPLFVPSAYPQDLFVTKLSADGGLLAYSTYLGGGNLDYGLGIAVDPSGGAYVTGYTYSLDFPTTAGAFQSFHTNTSPGAYISEAFVAKIEDDAPPPGPTPVPGEGRLENDDQAVHSSGPWFSNVLAGHSGGGAALAVDAGSRLVVTFKGTAFRWIGYRDEWSGFARVFLDGVSRGIVDTYATPAEYQAVVYAEHDLADEIHTLVIEVTGTHNPSSGGAWIWVDAFEVVEATCASGPATPEVCNGIDDDCDWLVDDSLGVTSCGTGGCFRSVDNCVGGALQTCFPGSPTTEACNAVDDDCDGAVDEDLGPVTCGMGACMRTIDTCVAGVLQTCVPGPPGAEICNGIDDDCDGIIDDAAGVVDPDDDGRAGACDNCPATPNVDQADANQDGSGDACQPWLTISGLHPGGEPDALYLAARTGDQQDDPLSGSFEFMAINETMVVLEDLGYTYDCGLAYLPEGVPDEGIGFAFGSIGEPVLVDVHRTIGCGDGHQTYELALGPCDAPRTVFTPSLSLSGVAPPAEVCLRESGEPQGGRGLTIVNLSRDFLRFSFTTITAAMTIPFAAGMPRRIDISSLSPGTRYTLRITVTDGNTVPVEAEAGFVSQGETTLVIASPPSAAAAALESTVECSGSSGGLVTLDASGSEDPDSSPGTNDDIASFEWFENQGLPAQTLLGTGQRLTTALLPGSHTVSLKVTDSVGLTATAGTVVTVVDSTAPLVELAPSPTVLWPANHKLVPVAVVLGMNDRCDPRPWVELIAIDSNDIATTTDDIQDAIVGADDRAFLLRAERGARGPARIYTIRYQAHDAAGNTTPTSAQVTVPGEKPPH